ncbi:MAG: hypothetical protein IKN35_01960, partial [Lachnospiraceae bacterium]|nr:hypothetical protein [Lachnospiraceae bacterium]
MKISFGNHDIQNNIKTDQGQISFKEPEKQREIKGGVRLDLGRLSALQSQEFFPGNSENSKCGKTLTELRDEAG